MALVKDELVEIAQKDEAGWWLVKKGGVEGWAPSNVCSLPLLPPQFTKLTMFLFLQYLELVPPTPKPRLAPAPAAPVRRAPPSTPTPSSAPSTPQYSRTADSNSQPVSVMPGMGNNGGLAAILAAKRAAAANAGGDDTPSGGSSPATSRPGSGMSWFTLSRFPQYLELITDFFFLQVNQNRHHPQSERNPTSRRNRPSRPFPRTTSPPSRQRVDPVRLLQTEARKPLPTRLEGSSWEEGSRNLLGRGTWRRLWRSGRRGEGTTE